MRFVGQLAGVQSEAPVRVTQARITRQSEIDWRTHIDGMRALSVISVLLYHVDLPYFSGGFVGVDVFFVISGFLISKIIFHDIFVYGRFRIARFYEHRIRRILPVFVVVTAIVLSAGYFFLLPDDFARVGESAVYASGFAANIFFYLGSDYFGPAAGTQPLLHYWSLGVEEQFYIAFPIFALVCFRTSPRLLLPGILAIAIGSFGLSVFSVRTEPAAAFYLAPQRAWELMAGSILALPRFPFPKWRALREPMAATGVGLILFAVFMYDSKTPFPGIAATVPVTGAVLILVGCERGGTVIATLLSLKPLRLVGLWSYSIYMFHWPLIVFTHLIWANVSLTLNIIVVALSVALGALSYLVVETPFRKPREFFCCGRSLSLAALILLATLSSAGLSAYESQGFASRLPSKVRDILAYKDYKDVATPLWRWGECFLGDTLTFESLDKNVCLHPKHPSALLWGDSHAADLYDPLSKAFEKHGIELSQANSTGCAPILEDNIPSHPNCQAFNEGVFEWIITKRPDEIVLSALWPLDQDDIEKLYKTVDDLTSLQIFVIVVGETPFYIQQVPDILARRLLRWDMNKFDDGKDNGRDQTSDYLLQKHYAESRNVIYISPKQIFCKNSACPLAGDDGLPLQFDSDHFTKQGAELAVHLMFGTPSIEHRIFASTAR